MGSGRVSLEIRFLPWVLIYNFNVWAGDPDLGGVPRIPPPAEHLLARFEVLRHDNVVLVEALLKLCIINRPQVPAGAALRVGANTQVCLLLRLPSWGSVGGSWAPLTNSDSDCFHNLFLLLHLPEEKKIFSNDRLWGVWISLPRGLIGLLTKMANKILTIFWPTRTLFWPFLKIP